MPTPLNILLVEDNDIDVDILRRSLKRIEAQGDLVRARDGIEALEILTTNAENTLPSHPFVVLLDINMPRMNGHEFMTSLRNDPKIAATQVMVFTTSDNPQDVRRAYSQNAAGYFVKPNTALELRKTLRTIWDYWDHCTHPPKEQLH